jgi:transcription termination factor Rho
MTRSVKGEVVASTTKTNNHAMCKWLMVLEKSQALGWAQKKDVVILLDYTIGARLQYGDSIIWQSFNRRCGCQRA